MKIEQLIEELSETATRLPGIKVCLPGRGGAIHPIDAVGLRTLSAAEARACNFSEDDQDDQVVVLWD